MEAGTAPDVDLALSGSKKYASSNLSHHQQTRVESDANANKRGSERTRRGEAAVTENHIVGTVQEFSSNTEGFSQGYYCEVGARAEERNGINRREVVTLSEVLRLVLSQRVFSAYNVTATTIVP